MDDETTNIEVTCTTEGCENEGISFEVPATSRVVCGPCGALLAEPSAEPIGQAVSE